MTQHRLAAAAALVVALLVPAPAARGAMAASGAATAPGAVPEVEPALAPDTALRLLGWQMSDLVRARAEFRLVRTDGRGQPVETGTGQLYVDRRGLLRLAFSEPDLRTLFVGSVATEVHDPARGRVDVFPFARHPDRWERFVHVAFTEPDRELGRDLLVEGTGQSTTERDHLFSLALRPDRDALGTDVTRLRVDYDTASFLPVHLHFELADGDRVDLRLHRRVLDPDLDPAWFRAEWPPGTERVQR